MNYIKATAAVIMAATFSFSVTAGAPKSSSNDNTAGGLTSLIGGVLEGILSTDKLSTADLAGTWNYSGPAISFKSDNFLREAGGAAAAATAKEKMSPYYKRLGFDKMTLEVEGEDGTFTMAVGRMKLSGTLTAEEPTEDSQANFTMKMSVGSIPVGTMDAYIVKTGTSGIELMFDVSKLITIAKAVGSITGNSTVKALTDVLESYDGICAGFALKKA